MKIRTFVVSVVVSLLFGPFSFAQAPMTVDIPLKELNEAWKDACPVQDGDSLTCFEFLNALVEGASPSQFVSYALIPTSMLNPRDFEVLRNKKGDEIYRNEFVVAVKKTATYLKDEYALKHVNFKELVRRDKIFTERFVRFVSENKQTANFNFNEGKKIIVNRLMTDSNRVSMILSALNKMASIDGDPYAYYTPNRGSTSLFEEGRLGITAFFNKGKMRIIDARPTLDLDRKGISVGDTVESIDGVTATPENMLEIFRRIQNVNKNTVDYKIKKTETEAIFEYKLSRSARIEDEMSSYVFKVGEYNVGVLAVHEFLMKQGDTCGEARERLHELLQPAGPPLKVLLLDLRGNNGGEMLAMECFLGLFLGSKKEIYKEVLLENGLYFDELLERNDKKKEKVFTTKSNRVVPVHLPLAVIVDANTASAGELTALILRSFNRAWIVGQRTYGKGIVQVLPENKRGQELDLRVTSSRFEAMNGFSPHLRGVTPDFIVSSPLLDFDGELAVARFIDENGAAFSSETTFEPVYKSRAEALKVIEKCIPSALSGATFGRDATRWLRDQQLRRATEVGLCIPPLN